MLSYETLDLYEATLDVQAIESEWLDVIDERFQANADNSGF
jgi:hypothetical protein